MRGRDRFVRRSFREAVLEALPRLKDDPQFRGMFELLAFGTFKDDDDPTLKVIPHTAVLDAVGLPPETPSKKFQSGPFLRRFRKVLPDFEFTDYSPKKKCRTVLKDGFSPKVRKLIEEELRASTTTEKDLVRFITGRKWASTERQRLIDDDLKETSTTSTTMAPASKKVIDYMNSVPHRLFEQRVRANRTAAITAAEALGDDGVDELRKLHRIVLQPQPFYGPSTKGATVRVFARNISINGLKNSVKYGLIDGWTTFDLRSAQLAIVSKEWGVDGVRKWLEEGNDVWSELRTVFEKVDPIRARSALKTAIYSLCYGAGKKRIGEDLKRSLGISKKDVKAFFKHWIVKDLYLYRRAVVLDLLEKNGVKDCFGRWLRCSGKKDVLSVLAQYSQAMELALLLPAIDLAIRSRKTGKKEFAIVLWEHDGFSVHFYQRPKLYRDRIVKAVNDECRRREFPTELIEKRST